MTVEQLIAALHSFPPKARVILNLGYTELANGCEVGQVKEVKGQKCNGRRDWIDCEWYEGDKEDGYSDPEPLVNLSPEPVWSK